MKNFFSCFFHHTRSTNQIRSKPARLVQNKITRWFLHLHIACFYTVRVASQFSGQFSQTSLFLAYDPFVPGSDKRTISCYLSSHKTRKIQRILIYHHELNCKRGTVFEVTMKHLSLISSLHKGKGTRLTLDSKSSGPLCVGSDSTPH